MKLLILILLIYNLWSFPGSNPGVDFNHRQIKKTITKELGDGNLCLEPINVPGLYLGADKSNGSFFSIQTSGSGDSVYYVYIGRVNSCRAGGCSVPSGADHDYSMEYFDYFVLFNPQGHVMRVGVFNYQATYGYEISSRGWLKQFIGFNGSGSLRVGAEIDAISGATISVHGITSDIHEKTLLLKDFHNRQVSQQKNHDTTWTAGKNVKTK